MYVLRLQSAQDVEYLKRAIDSELQFTEWLLRRTMQQIRSKSAAELSVELADLRRLREGLRANTLQVGKQRRLKAG